MTSVIVCDDDDDVCSAKRTQVIDDESDYFATDSNQWLTFKQRDSLRSKEAQIRAKRHASRRDRSRQVTLDFTGRRVIEEDRNIVAPTGEDTADTVTEFNPDDFTVDLVNPNMRLPEPPQVYFLDFLMWDLEVGHYGVHRTTSLWGIQTKELREDRLKLKTLYCFDRKSAYICRIYISPSQN